MALRHLENVGLGLVQKRLHVLHRGQAGLGDVLAAGQQAPQHRLVVDQLGIIGGVGRGAHVFAEGRQKNRAPHVLQAAPLFQEGGHRHQVNRFTLAPEIQHGLKDVAVAGAVKVFRG